MKVLFTLISLFISQLLLAQTPIVDWAKCYGGSNSDRAYSAIQTSDGGYLVCGYTNSADGDVTQNKGSADAWLVKTNPDGSILWQRPTVEPILISSDQLSSAVQVMWYVAKPHRMMVM